LTTKSRNIKNGIIKTKIRDTATKFIGMENHPAYSALYNTLNDMKIERPIKKVAINVNEMEVEPMELCVF